MVITMLFTSVDQGSKKKTTQTQADIWMWFTDNMFFVYYNIFPRIFVRCFLPHLKRSLVFPSKVSSGLRATEESSVSLPEN